MAKFQQPRHTARAIVVHEGQLLLMERWRDDLHYFSIPGGGIEQDETPEETVVREIFEETTITVEVEELAVEMHDDGRVHKIFVCKYITGEPHLPEESEEFVNMTPNNRFKPCWVSVEEVKDLPYLYWEPVRDAVVDILENGFDGQVKIVTRN